MLEQLIKKLSVAFSLAREMSELCDLHVTLSTIVGALR